MARLTPPRAILFDWDGTLVDTLPGLLLAHNHVRSLHGLPLWSWDDFMLNIKFSSRELYPSIYGNDWQAAWNQLYEFVLAHHLEHLTLLPGAAALIGFLGARRVPIGIVSNKRQLALDREVDHLGWRGAFYCVFGAGAAPRDKPAGDPVTLALTSGGNAFTAAETWFVGDMISDMAAAREAGCPAILLTHGEDKSALVADYRPVLVVDDCPDLLARVQDVFA